MLKRPENYCCICDELLPEETSVCSSEACQQIDRECAEYWESERKALWWMAFRKCFRQRCKGLDGVSGRVARWFYSLKCFACLLIDRTATESYYDHVEVATLYSNQLYAGWEAGWVQVGHGVFRNWFYEIVEDGDWNM